MPNCDQYPSSRASSPEFGDTQTAFPSAGAPTMAAVFGSIVTAQFAVFELMNQCALAWINLPASVADTASLKDNTEQHQVYGTRGLGDYSRVAIGAGWLEPQFITGVEDTLNDEFFKPRPRMIQERDMLVLLERGGEAAANSAPPDTQETEMHPKAA